MATSAPGEGGHGRLGQMVSNVAANWYTTVMGTGIVAVAAATLPQRISGLHTAATAMWALSAFLLIGLVALTAAQWQRHPAVARARLTDLNRGTSTVPHPSLCLAIAITVRTKRSGSPFSLAWWSFTFPLGTYVTGTSALALRTGSDPFRVYAAALYIALVHLDPGRSPHRVQRLASRLGRLDRTALGGVT